MGLPAQPPERSRGNFVSEWFGHRVYPEVVANESSLADQCEEACPFLSQATGERRRCIKPPASLGVCTVNTPSARGRRDWLVCPYRAFDPALMESAIRRLFDFPDDQSSYISPAIRLVQSEAREAVNTSLAAGGRAFVYFDSKLGGELGISRTDQSPEFSFDVTVIEIELLAGVPHVGRFGIVEIQTMDFHGSYKHVVANLKDGLRLHPSTFPETLSHNQQWLSERMEGPNIANVFKRTFYQMMFKFQLGQSSQCAGCVLAVPVAVWESWQRHLGGAQPTQEPDGTFSLFEPGRRRPETVPAWIYAFELDANSERTPSPISTPMIIATDAKAMSYFALELAPAKALSTLDSPSGMIMQMAKRLSRLWPELGQTITI